MPDTPRGSAAHDPTCGICRPAFDPVSALKREIEAREHPPHLDGQYREGIHAGLQLALRIITGTPDEHPDEQFPDDPDSINVHRYPTCRVATDA